MPAVGLEPTTLEGADFKSAVFTNFTTSASSPPPTRQILATVSGGLSMAIWAQKSQVAKAVVPVVAIDVIQFKRNGLFMPASSHAFHALVQHHSL